MKAAVGAERCRKSRRWEDAKDAEDAEDAWTYSAVCALAINSLELSFLNTKIVDEDPIVTLYVARLWPFLAFTHWALSLLKLRASQMVWREGTIIPAQGSSFNLRLLRLVNHWTTQSIPKMWALFFLN